MQIPSLQDNILSSALLKTHVIKSIIRRMVPLCSLLMWCWNIKDSLKCFVEWDRTGSERELQVKYLRGEVINRRWLCASKVLPNHSRNLCLHLSHHSIVFLLCVRRSRPACFIVYYLCYMSYVAHRSLPCFFQPTVENFKANHYRIKLQSFIFDPN